MKLPTDPDVLESIKPGDNPYTQIMVEHIDRAILSRCNGKRDHRQEARQVLFGRPSQTPIMHASHDPHKAALV